MVKKYFFKDTFDIPLLRGELIVLITNQENKVKEFIPSFDKNLYAHSALYEHENGKQSYMLILNFDSELRKIHHGTIAHEALHIAGFIAKKRGIQPSFSNDEVIAYLIEWITDKIYELTEKYKLNKKIK